MSILATKVIVAAVIAVLTKAGEWKMLEKMGENGWKALVPFYGDYLFFKKVWNTQMFWLFNAALFAGCVMSAVIDRSKVGLPEALAALAVIMVSTGINVVLVHKLAKAFGHGFGYTVGLLFVPEIFNMLLGFGKSNFERA